MASKTTVTAENLEALGAARLAALLVELGEGDADLKRRLRLDLAGAAGPAEAAREIRKRLTTIARGRAFIDWEKRKAFAADLEIQRRAILDQVAKGDPGEALDLLWQFTALANPVFKRCDDSSGAVIGEFRAACQIWPRSPRRRRPEPQALADRTFEAICDNDYGQYDDLIAQLAPALGREGLEHLKARVEELARATLPVPSDKDRRLIGWASGGPIFAARSRAVAPQHRPLALEAIADAQGDVDAFIAQKSENAKTVPRSPPRSRSGCSPRVGQRMPGLRSSRGERSHRPMPFEWQEAARGHGGARMAVQAQAFRWACFERASTRGTCGTFSSGCPTSTHGGGGTCDRLGHPSPRFHEALWFLLGGRRSTAPPTSGDAPGRDRRRPTRSSRPPPKPSRRNLPLAPRCPAGDDRLHAGRAQSNRYRYAAGHLLECQGLAGRSRTSRLRDPRRLSRSAEGRARPQGVLLGHARLSAPGVGGVWCHHLQHPCAISEPLVTHFI